MSTRDTTFSIVSTLATKRTDWELNASVILGVAYSRFKEPRGRGLPYR